MFLLFAPDLSADCSGGLHSQFCELVKLCYAQRSEARGTESSLEMMNAVLLPHKSGSSLVTESPHWEDGSAGVMLFSLAIVLRIQ